MAVDDLCIITRDEEEMIVEGEKTIFGLCRCGGGCWMMKR